MHIDEAVRSLRQSIIESLSKAPSPQYHIGTLVLEEARRGFPDTGLNCDWACIELSLTTGKLWAELSEYPSHYGPTRSGSVMLSAASFARIAEDLGFGEMIRAFKTEADWDKLFDAELVESLYTAGIEYLPAKLVYERVTVREAGLWDGSFFTYSFLRGLTDLHPEGIFQGPECQSMRGGLRIIANLAKHILDIGGKIHSIVLSQEGDDDPYDYKPFRFDEYDSFESFLESYSNRLYDDYIAFATFNDAEIRVEFNCTDVNVRFPMKQAAAGIAYIHELVKAFGSDSFHEEPGSDELQWDAQTQTVLRTFRLDKAGECFLHTVMNTDGRITGYRLISNAKVAAQYELPPENADAFKQILYKETHKNAAGHIAECCAMYLQHHTPQQLIALAEKHSLIEKHAAETD